MQGSVTQVAKLQPIQVVSLAWSWGWSDGFNNESIYDGYDYFAGHSLGEYFRGYVQGQAEAVRQMVSRCKVLVLEAVREQYVPFQQPKEFYDGHGWPAEQRADYVGD